MMSNKIEITGIHLVSPGKNYMEVKIEVNGEWVSVIKEYWVQDGVTSHIVEVLGMQKAIDAERVRQ